jgi:hypothetical protein
VAGGLNIPRPAKLTAFAAGEFNFCSSPTMFVRISFSLKLRAYAIILGFDIESNAVASDNL